MTREPFSWIEAWAGAVVVGVLAGGWTALAYGNVGSRYPVFLWGLALAIVVGLGAWWAYRRGEIGLAVGIVGGYSILSLMSAGQCTMLIPQSPEATGAIVGAFGYPMLLIAMVLTLALVEGIQRLRRNREGRP